MSDSIGILGGAFDPIHYGHLLLASEARMQLNLARIIFVPTFQSPHHLKSIPTPFTQRCELVRRAIAAHCDFELSDIEKQFEGPSFSVETLKLLKEQLPNNELVFIVGADNLENMSSWFKPEELFDLATVAVACRSGHKVEGSQYHDRVRQIQMPQVDISARDIRRRVKDGVSIRFLVPPEVESYIHERGLYKD